MPKTRVTNIFVAPKFKLPIVPKEFVGLGDALIFAPGYSCQRLSAPSSLNSCGSDLHLYSSQEKNGHKFFEIQFQNLDDTETLTGMLSLNFPLNSQPKTFSRSISANGGQRLIEKPYSHQNTHFFIRSKRPLVDELVTVISPKSPMTVSDRKIRPSEERGNLLKNKLVLSMTKKAPANAIKWQINTSHRTNKNGQGSLVYPGQKPTISDQPSTSRLTKSSMKVQFEFIVN